MQTFAQKQNQFQEPRHANAIRFNAPKSSLDHVQRAHLNLQRTLGNQAIVQMSPFRAAIQTKLTINQPGDEYEQEADRVAEQIMQRPEQKLQRACACGGKGSTCETEQSDQEVEYLQTKRVSIQELGQTEIPTIVHDVVRSPGQSLDAPTRAFFEPRLGYDLSSVRVHNDEKATESARSLHALGYTVGRDIVFGRGQYSPGTLVGKQLLAHELTHVVQQRALQTSAAIVQRQPDPMQQHMDDMDMEMERKYANSGAPKAQTCGRPSWCPPGFCSPYNSEKLAEYYRAKRGPLLLAGIYAAVDSRVVPFWKEYLNGGSAPKNITADFSKDFTNSPTTKKTTVFLTGALKTSLSAKPPAVSSTVSLDIATLIPAAIAALNDRTSSNRMNFSAPRDIPGNLAGDIGTNQTSCPAGAQPSPFNDERSVIGVAKLVRKSDSELEVTPFFTYTVKDTIDLCPGDCGTTLEQVATVPLSQFEATGIAGDVPFTVVFPAPSLGSFTISAPKGP
jgi:hypothetical protein